MGQIESFQEARMVYEVITRNLSQATLNTYLDYDNPNDARRYLRKSELKFMIGKADGTGLGTVGTGQQIFFQAPLGYVNNTISYGGLEALLNTCGYYVSFSRDAAIPAHVSQTNNPYRYRLMQMLVPSESNTIYKTTGVPDAWYSAFATEAQPVANNIIALIIRPQDPATLISAPSSPPNNSYTYDSTASALADPQPVTANQLPPVVQVTMVAIDDASAKRLDSGASEPKAITDALAGKFSDNPAAFETEMAQLVRALEDARINYRIFSSAVPMREAKWTK